MNIHTKPVKKATKVASKVATRAKGMTEAERDARVDLAAVYRLVAHNDWDDVIYNHCSMRVPGEPTKFLMKRHELLWTEVTASNLAKVDMNDAVIGPVAGSRITHWQGARLSYVLLSIVCLATALIFVRVDRAPAARDAGDDGAAAGGAFGTFAPVNCFHFEKCEYHRSFC